MSEVISSLFTERLRPQKLEQMLLVDRIKNQLVNELNSEHGIVSNLLFYGSTPGCGKCLGYDEKITIYVDEATNKKIKKFLKKS